jgi:hypothetical protein
LKCLKYFQAEVEPTSVWGEKEFVAAEVVKGNLSGVLAGVRSR